MNPRVRAYFELLRFPAVFTAIADVMMAYLITHGSFAPWYHFALLVSASSCMYLAGMVLNDVFDAEIDAIERPTRPIPSGRIEKAAAARLGWQLLFAGICVAWTVSWSSGNWRPGAIGTLLAGCIVLYDGVLKQTPFAPVVMGGCRFLNVLFGMSLATGSRFPFGPQWQPYELAIALGIGTYVAGLTWFARSEAQPGNRPQLGRGVAVMLVGLLILEVSGQLSLRPAHHLTEQSTWQLLWLGLSLVILGRAAWAIWRMEPRAVQIAVRNSLRALIVIDAALVLGALGPAWASAVLALLVPMLLVERWASTT